MTRSSNECYVNKVIPADSIHVLLYICISDQSNFVNTADMGNASVPSNTVDSIKAMP